MHLKLPPGAKPSKVLSKDQSRPVLTRGELAEVTKLLEDGTRERTGWELQCTDSYRLSRVPLSISGEATDDSEITAGPISGDALRMIEKHGGFRADAEHVEVIDKSGRVVVTYDRERAGDFPYPNIDAVTPEPEHYVDIGLNAKFLYELAQALGSRDTTVRIRLSLNERGEVNPLRPFVVTANMHETGTGVLMPVRLNV